MAVSQKHLLHRWLLAIVSATSFLVCSGQKSNNCIALTDSGWIAIHAKTNTISRPFLVDNGPDDFSNGLCRIVKDNKIGYINRKGQVVISPKYDCAERFMKGKAKVSTDCATVPQGEYYYWVYRSYFMVNKKGEVQTQ